MVIQQKTIAKFKKNILFGRAPAKLQAGSGFPLQVLAYFVAAGFPLQSFTQKK